MVDGMTKDKAADGIDDQGIHGVGVGIVPGREFRLIDDRRVAHPT